LNHRFGPAFFQKESTCFGVSIFIIASL